jgi:hypothetical protein
MAGNGGVGDNGTVEDIQIYNNTVEGCTSVFHNIEEDILANVKNTVISYNIFDAVPSGEVIKIFTSWTNTTCRFNVGLTGCYMLNMTHVGYGTTTPDGSGWQYLANTNVTVTWTPNSLATRLNFSVDGTNVTTISPAYVNMTTDHVCIAYFTSIELSVTLDTPINGASLSATPVSFSFTPTSYGTTITSASLWTNASGTWASAITITSVVNGSSNTINFTFSATGVYIWNIQITNSTYYVFAPSNYTLTILTTLVPTVISVNINFAEFFTQFLIGTGSWLGLLIILILNAVLRKTWKYMGLVTLPITIILGTVYLTNGLGWQGLIMFVAGTFNLIYVGIEMKK